MQWLTKKTIAKTYLIAMLIIGMTVSPLPEFMLAIALLALNLYTTYKRLTPKVSIALLLGTSILAPLTIAPLTGNILSSLFILPAIYLLDKDLKEYTLAQTLQPQKRTREPTPLLKSTVIALGTTLATSLILVNLSMISATIVLIVYFTVISGIAIIKIPKRPLQETKTWSRLLAGNTEKKTIQLTSLTKQSLYLTITSLQTWVQVKQPIYQLKANKHADVEVTFTPPLAGPTKIQLQASTLDVYGLIQITQLLEPIELQVIPRAKYAQWLAKKLLEHTGSGTSSATAETPLKALKAARRSIEYYGNRPYQPGDKLREVDWKHTYMLGELTVKEFAGAHGQPIIIVANLTAKDAQDADRLVYNVVMAALTAATETLPSGLACFNQREVLASISPTNPRETLKKTLQITQKITIVKQLNRVLQLNEIRLTGKTINQLDQTQLTDILKLKFNNTKAAAKANLAVQALLNCINNTPSPVIIAVASSKTIDENALSGTMKQLKEKGYSMMFLDN